MPQLKFESGTHRVQRVPATESQGRIHTSTCTVAVLPEIAEVESIEINPADLRIGHLPLLRRRRPARQQDRLRGAHHAPADRHRRRVPGRTLPAQEPRQGDGAPARPAARSERERQAAEKAEKRRLQVGTGDRSERIRTYNFPQGRLTDHRIELTLYRLDSIVDGDLDEVVESLAREHQAEELAALE